MNIKSLLIGSAAALAAATGAQAADAIIAAEPEPMEYVRVCDAFGTGYFYIPGTETCLQISGYVRFQAAFLQDAKTTDSTLLRPVREDGYNTFTRGYVSLDAKSDTELGTLTGHIDLQADSHSDTFLDGAWIELAGFKAGYFYNFWDKGINGETDALGSNLLNAVSYTYDGGAFSVSGALESFNNEASVANTSSHLQFAGLDGGKFSDISDDWGVSGLVTGSFGGASIDLLGSYDFDAEEGAIRGLVSADIGPGALQVAGVWASGISRYWFLSEWSVAASYKAQINEKFAITPGFQYFGDRSGFSSIAAGGGLNADFTDNDAWRAGVTLDYMIVSGLTSKVSVQYNDIEGATPNAWSGFVRLERSF
jgi:hypothetical protein